MIYACIYCAHVLFGTINTRGDLFAYGFVEIFRVMAVHKASMHIPSQAILHANYKILAQSRLNSKKKWVHIWSFSNVAIDVHGKHM